MANDLVQILDLITKHLKKYICESQNIWMFQQKFGQRGKNKDEGTCQFSSFSFPRFGFGLDSKPGANWPNMCKINSSLFLSLKKKIKAALEWKSSNSLKHHYKEERELLL